MPITENTAIEFNIDNYKWYRDKPKCVPLMDRFGLNVSKISFKKFHRQ